MATTENHAIIPVENSTSREEKINKQKTNGEDVVKKVKCNERNQVLGKNKLRALYLLELIAFLLVLGLLVASLNIDKLRNETKIWDLKLWKWCVLMLVIICGRNVTDIVAFVLKHNLLITWKELYFVLRLGSFKVCVWLGFVLLAWCVLFIPGVHKSHENKKILKYVTRTLIACLIASTIWLAQTLLIKLLDYNFHMKRSFKRIRDSIFMEQVLCSLLTTNNNKEDFVVRYSTPKSEENIAMIKVDSLKTMEREHVKPWIFFSLVEVITSEKSPMYNLLGGEFKSREGKLKGGVYGINRQVKIAANQFYRDLHHKPGADHDTNYINVDSLLPYWKSKEDIEKIFKGAKSGKIKKSVFKERVVNFYKDRHSLIRSLSGINETVEDLGRLTSGVILVVICIVWLLVMGFLTTEVLILIASQLLLASFMFGNSAKSLFESIIYVFMAHPFYVGDRCKIDGQELMVHKMNISNTVFLTPNGEKVYYPNSVLTGKSITNYYESPDRQDSVEFSIWIGTIDSDEAIKKLEAEIEQYLKSKPKHWSGKEFSVSKKDKTGDKLVVVVDVNHAINYLDNGDRSWRKALLIIELKNILKKLNFMCAEDELDKELTKIYQEVGIKCDKVDDYYLNPKKLFNMLGIKY